MDGIGPSLINISAFYLATQHYTAFVAMHYNQDCKHYCGRHFYFLIQFVGHKWLTIIVKISDKS